MLPPPELGDANFNTCLRDIKVSGLQGVLWNAKNPKGTHFTTPANTAGGVG